MLKILVFVGKRILPSAGIFITLTQHIGHEVCSNIRGGHEGSGNSVIHQ